MSFPSLFSKKSKKTGLVPGVLVYVGDEPNTQPVKITLMNFNDESFSEEIVHNIEECVPYAKEKEHTTWVHVEGLSDVKCVEQIGKFFDIHRLWLEDVLNMDHLPKTEELDDLLFIILKTVSASAADQKRLFKYEQLSIFLGDNFVVSFHPSSNSIFETIRDRIRNKKGRIRQSKADYLFYAIVDCAVDQYFNALESLSQKIEILDEEIDDVIDIDIPKKISHLRNETLTMRKSVLPLRDSLAQICKSHREDIEEKTKIYFKDVYDHALQIVDIISSDREVLVGMQEVYFGILNHKLNEAIKILTMFTSFFIPPTFIVGLYGMNFVNFPEIQWKYGYLFAWSIILMSTITLFIFYKRKKWF